MPTDVFRNLIFVETLGQAWSQYVPRVIASFSSQVTGDVEISPATVVDVGPNRALFLQERNLLSDLIVEYYWVILSIPAGGQIPLRVALNDPGLTSTYNNGLSVAFELSDYPTLWNADVRDAKGAVLEAITPGVVATMTTMLAQAYSDQLFTYTGVVPIFALDCSGVSLDVFRMADYGIVAGFNVATIGDPLQPPATPAVGIIGLGDLVTAVEEVADLDAELSLNNGAYVYSMKGRVLVGGE